MIDNCIMITMSEKLQNNRVEDVIENNDNVNANEKWAANTPLIVADSIISGVIEKKMRIKKYTSKSEIITCS